MPDPSLLAELSAQFDVVEESIDIGPRTLRIVHPRSADALLSEEDFAVDERIPYWAEIWISARVLARQVAEQQGTGRRLIELGCGAGLVAVAAASAGFDVLASDYYAEALRFVQLNAQLNNVPEPATRALDWRAWPADLGQFDVVLAADVLYEPAYSQLVAQTIARSLAPGGQAWVADPERSRAEPFPDFCRQQGLSVILEKIPATHQGRAQQVSLYRLAWA